MSNQEVVRHSFSGLSSGSVILNGTGSYIPVDNMLAFDAELTLHGLTKQPLRFDMVLDIKPGQTNFGPRRLRDSTKTTATVLSQTNTDITSTTTSPFNSTKVSPAATKSPSRQLPSLSILKGKNASKSGPATTKSEQPPI